MSGWIYTGRDTKHNKEKGMVLLGGIDEIVSEINT